MQTPLEIIADLERRLSAMERTRQAAAGSGSSIPAGAFMLWGGATTAPDGWLACGGQAVSRSTYAALFAVLGTRYGAGDGSTTFNLPQGTDAFLQAVALATTARAVSASTAAANASHSHGVSVFSANASHSHGGSTSSSSHTHTVSTDTQGSHSHSYSDVWNSSGGTTSGSKSTGSAGSHSHGGSTGSGGGSLSITTDTALASHSHSASSDTANASHSHTATVVQGVLLVKT
jgi:microcystin-dependent protein